MVTRVDKKPIIYNTCLLRALKPAVVTSNKKLIDQMLAKATGHRVPAVSTRELLDDYEEIESAFRMFGIDDPAYSIFGHIPEEEEDEAIRFARVCLDKNKTARQVLRNEGLCEAICKVQKKLLSSSDKVYFGTEAVYKVFTNVLFGNIFKDPKSPSYKTWCLSTAKRILVQQSAYLLIHPTAINDMAEKMASDMDSNLWYAWDLFKKTETMAIRIGSRKNMLAHAFYSGMNRKGFTPDDLVEADFELPMTGYAEVCDHVKVYMLLGLRYVKVGGEIFVLSQDDSINLSSMAQCYFRTAMYFTKSNGYPAGSMLRATTLVRDIALHCCKLIDAGKNFSHIIRSMHILSQGEFNDMFEEDFGTDLGWRERSSNYRAESHALDPMGRVFHKRATDLAVDRIDKLNTCFIYHVFVGDEMSLDDLRAKVSGMTKKVLPADKGVWDDFINFVKAYTLSRFMMVNKKKPRCGGDISQLNLPWANRCIAGNFTMPPHAEWGKIWIEGEFSYTEFANVWHLEAQDVAYVMKDSAGVINGKYAPDKKAHSELLMAMSHGNVLDTLRGTTPSSARERICTGGHVSEVVLTTAPKAENAKPSWKKRVTFAADCEFRKMQAEYDRNCRRIMSFVRGPSLGVDQCILEKQFADIADATATGLNGAICSHDISAWSESMDRGRKFEFESVLIRMFDKPEMLNISLDWQKINAVVTKQGCKDITAIDNGSFQGFDGSASTLLHSMILIYCIDTARRASVISTDVKTNMATLIDDCIALMLNLYRRDEAVAFWAHLKDTYLKLGFEVDDLKSIFSTVKAIYLSRRFMAGGEVPADLKVFIKAHSSYEDPLRCSLDVPNDIFGAMRGACDANGEAWYIYFCSAVSVLAELAHVNSKIVDIPPSGAAVFALAPVTENGWGFPSIISWSTNDVTDKRAHFNAIMELAAVHATQPDEFTKGVDVYPRPVAKAMYAIKSQAWRLVSYSNIFTNPFEALREGPLKPDMLRRNAVQDMLEDVATAEPWKSLLKWSNSTTTTRVRELLIQSGPLHAPTLAALVNCMPDNYRLSLVGKAMGSESLLSLLSTSKRIILKRRIARCSMAYFAYTKALYDSSNYLLTEQDTAAMTYTEKTKLEREEFYTANGVTMSDHTFPDPVATFTVTGTVTQSLISPNLSGLRIWDKAKVCANRMSQLISDKGIYVPRRSGRVWEVTCEYARGWDSVSQRVAMGLAILARAEADGHSVEGLLSYFIKSWNELSNITPNDTHLIAIHGSIKRLDANPGSSTHPVIVNRNILRGFHNTIKTALNAIPGQCLAVSGRASHLHDFLAHETAMTCVTALMLGVFQFLGVSDYALKYNIATRPPVVIPECDLRMETGRVANMIEIEIMDGADNYGLLQACPSLMREIAIPTMKSSWVRMINALMDRDSCEVERLLSEAASSSMEELEAKMKDDEVFYSPSVILASEPASRMGYASTSGVRLTIAPNPDSARAVGDNYTTSVRTVGSKFSRALTEHQPEHIMAATAVRSLLWSRLKDISAVQLSKHLFMDPDADNKLLERCGKEDFWRAAIVEISKLRKTMSTSELAMSAFRSLGVPGIHLMANNDTKALSHAVASFFGANLRLVTVMISDLITSLAGRKNEDFSRPFTERVVTNNPALMNAKLRKTHILKLIESNIETYKSRIDALSAGNPSHRGDMRVAELAKHSRLVELRCRMYTYLAASVDDAGRAEVNLSKLAQIIKNAARRVYDKVGLVDEEPPDCDASYDGIFEYMATIHSILIDAHTDRDHGWDPSAGQLGVRMASQTLSVDADMVMNTKFAVSASEIAPRLHRKVIITREALPVVKQAEPPCIAWDDSDSDGEDLLAMDDAAAMAAINRGKSTIGIPLWQGLYTLLITGQYSAADVNAKLHCSLPADVTPSALRESNLAQFSDGAIQAALPSLMADYVSSGAIFDKTWLDRDEADAYTTDEIKNLRVGYLF